MKKNNVQLLRGQHRLLKPPFDPNFEDGVKVPIF